MWPTVIEQRIWPAELARLQRQRSPARGRGARRAGGDSDAQELHQLTGRAVKMILTGL